MRVVTRPSASFDGTTNVTFAAIGEGPPFITSKSIGSSSNNDVGSPISSTAHQGQRVGTVWSSQGESQSAPPKTTTTEASDTVSFDVTYFHCGVGSFWNLSSSGAIAQDEDTDTCPSCADGVEGATEVRELKGGRWVHLQPNFLRCCVLLLD